MSAVVLPILRRAEWFAPLVGVLLAAAIVRAAPDSALNAAMVASALLVLVVWIAWQDLVTFTISDAALVAVALIAFALRWSNVPNAGEPWTHAAVGMALDVALCGGSLLVFREAFYRLKGIDGLGLGDCKLAAAGALLIGGIGFSWALFAASAGALAVVLVRRRLGSVAAPIERIAFGAALAPAIGLTWVAEQLFPRVAGA